MNHTRTNNPVDAHVDMYNKIFGSVTNIRAPPLIFGETNSLYNQGRPGLSNTFGAALWGIDFNLYSAAAGFKRVHMHQGTNYRVRYYFMGYALSCNLTGENLSIKRGSLSLRTRPPWAPKHHTMVASPLQQCFETPLSDLSVFHRSLSRQTKKRPIRHIILPAQEDQASWLGLWF